MKATNSTRRQIEEIIKEHGFQNFQWIPTEQIVVSQWVRMKCMYGRDFYGQGKSTGEIIEMIYDKHTFCYYPKNTTNEAYSALVSDSNRLLMNRQKLEELPSFIRI